MNAYAELAIWQNCRLYKPVKPNDDFTMSSSQTSQPAFIQIPITDIELLDRLSKNALKLYLLLRKSLNRKSGQCNPTPESLGWESSKYYRARKELELLGLVEFEGKQATFSANRQNGDLAILQNGESDNGQKINGETPNLSKEYIYIPEPEEKNQRESAPEDAFAFASTDEPMDNVPETLAGESSDYERKVAEVACENLGHWAARQKVRTVAGELQRDGFTAADLDAFRKAKGATALNFLARDMRIWREKRKAQPARLHVPAPQGDYWKGPKFLP